MHGHHRDRRAHQKALTERAKTDGSRDERESDERLIAYYSIPSSRVSVYTRPPPRARPSPIARCSRYLAVSFATFATAFAPRARPLSAATAPAAVIAASPPHVAA